MNTREYLEKYTYVDPRGARGPEGGGRGRIGSAPPNTRAAARVPRVPEGLACLTFRPLLPPWPRRVTALFFDAAVPRSSITCARWSMRRAWASKVRMRVASRCPAVERSMPPTVVFVCTCVRHAEVPPNFFNESDDEEDNPDERSSGAAGPTRASTPFAVFSLPCGACLRRLVRPRVPVPAYVGGNSVDFREATRAADCARGRTVGLGRRGHWRPTQPGQPRAGSAASRCVRRPRPLVQRGGPCRFGAGRLDPARQGYGQWRCGVGHGH